MHSTGALVIESRDPAPALNGSMAFGIDPARARLFTSGGLAIG